MKFQITINIEGDAFARNPCGELGRALDAAARKAYNVFHFEEDGEVVILEEVDSKLLDSNGNTVGRVTLTA